MLYKDKWHISRHNIPDHASSNPGNDADKNQQKNTVIAHAQGSIDSYNCKCPKTNSVHDIHPFFIHFHKTALQKLLAQPEKPKKQAGGDNSRQGIGAVAEHVRGINPQNKIPDQPPAQRRCHCQDIDSENIHIFSYCDHCPGRSKSHSAYHFYNINCKA